MSAHVRLAAGLLLSMITTATAGSLTEGKWTPTACGVEPPAVTLDLSSVGAYNRSIAAVQTWQKQTNAYSACLIGEANADNGAIVAAVNAAQQRAKAGFERIKADADSAPEKLGLGAGMAPEDGQAGQALMASHGG
jgi:hypothetical protein